MMENEFVTYDMVLRIKALGFNEPCVAFFNGKHLDLEIWNSEYIIGEKLRDIGECPKVPLYQQAFKFMCEKYGYCSYIKEVIVGTYRFYIEKFDEKYYNSSKFLSYEEAQHVLKNMVVLGWLRKNYILK